MYDMGMKVAAVSIMCQDKRVWDAMRMAGTPCPYEGKIGDEAAALWEANPERSPKGSMGREEKTTWKDLGNDVEYKTWNKKDFCNEWPEEDICKLKKLYY